MLAFLRSTLATAAVLAVLAPTAARAQTTFTSFTDFLAAVGPSGVDRFDDLTDSEPIEGPLNRQAGSYNYSVAANGSGSPLFFPLANPDNGGDTWLSTEDADASMTFTGFGSEVRAVGGRFFATDLDGFLSGTDLIFIAEDSEDNVVERMLSSQSTDAFFGVLFDNPILSLRIVAVNEPRGDPFFATANDLVLAEAPVVAPVPEPSTLLLIAAPLLLLAARRPRRNA